MQTISKILSSLALALMTGGSAAIVFAAVVLVKAATLKGIPVAEAAATNAPLFIQYSKVALVAAILLFVAELIHILTVKIKGKLDYCRYLSSVASISLVFVFALVIVPPMERLLPDIASVKEAHGEFHRLHELSRAVFGGSILFAFISLLLPAFAKKSESKTPDSQASELNQAASIKP